MASGKRAELVRFLKTPQAAWKRLENSADFLFSIARRASVCILPAPREATIACGFGW
jgi:hypothetical protein